MRTQAVIVLAGIIVSPAIVSAQVNMRYDPQANGQYSGRVDTRVDGRASRNEGLPPSAADKGYGKYENPIRPSDCWEVQAMNPNARRSWQRRVERACNPP